MRLLYKPFAIISGIVGVRLGRVVFKGLWSRIDTGDPPRAVSVDASYAKVVGAAALEGATMAGVTAVVVHAAARWFRFLTGIRPDGPPGDETQNEPGAATALPSAERAALPPAASDR
jgi:hypothetical protein